jgi:GIY-YIG domain-containing protein
MARWTDWRKIADRNNWYSENLDWNGAACYELALAGPRGGNIQPVYVGKTCNEFSRISSYARSGSHLHAEINLHLRRGYTLFYRARATSSEFEAKNAESSLLAKYDYDWNLKENTWGK